MLKGFAITPPVVGRISIGKVIEKNGRRLPEKSDEFLLASLMQGRDGWIPHPLDETLRKDTGAKLRSIPVRLLFNDPELNLRANYSMFDRSTGRPVCVGNGESCRRVITGKVETKECAGPDLCSFNLDGGCKPYGRLNVRIGDDDELGSFIFRTTGFNSIRSLSARLQYFQAVSGGHLATLPLELRLRGKSTTQSHRTPIYYVDLTVRAGMALVEAIANAKAESAHRLAAGFDQDALDESARKGFAAGAFEESSEEGAAVVEEFYPAEESNFDSSQDLAGKLEHKLARQQEGSGEAHMSSTVN
jgi:hypothetical protein